MILNVNEKKKKGLLEFECEKEFSEIKKYDENGAKRTKNR